MCEGRAAPCQEEVAGPCGAAAVRNPEEPGPRVHGVCWAGAGPVRKWRTGAGDGWERRRLRRGRPFVAGKTGGLCLPCFLGAPAVRPVLDVFPTVHAEEGGGGWKFILSLFSVQVFPFLSSVLFSFSSHIFFKLVFSVDSESFFLDTPCSIQDISSPTTDHTCAPLERKRSIGPPGKSPDSSF